MNKSQVKILRTIGELRAWRDTQSQTVSFVPTMGALHQGHASLFHQALSDSPCVIASIFVNPTQFNDPKDLENYPRTLDADLALLGQQGVAAVFLPNANQIYADQYRFQLTENQLSQDLCGASRPGHFAGVLTVVLKLFNLVKPNKVYFGEKDFQQLSLIQAMVKALFLDIEVIACKTLREADGLAMSSRNCLLTAQEREKAPFLFRALTESSDAEEARMRLTQAGFRVDYVADKDGRRYGAAYLGSVRLIDNVEIT